MQAKAHIAHLKPGSAGHELGLINMRGRAFLAKAALIILITVVTYLPALRGGFVFDDYPLIIDSQLVKTSDGLPRIWFTTDASDYYPLTWSLWWLEWRLWGTSAMGYHVVNVLLHAVNAVLVWMVLQRLKIPAAWLAAAVFAIHPVNVATVAWISEQKTTLSMLFYALAILLYLRFDEGGRWRWYTLSLAAFLLALLSKNAVVMLSVVLLGYVWWRRSRLRWKDVLYSVPFFALSLIFGMVAIWFHNYHVLKGHPVQAGGFLSRLLGAGWVPWFYLYKTLLPFDLTVIYSKWDIDATRWMSYAPGTILMACFALFWWKRRTWGWPLLFALGYFVATLFPVLGFFDQSFYKDSLVADHWQYYSIVGVIALVVAAGDRVCRRMGQRGNDIGLLASGITLILLAAATWTRAGVYKDDETLWRDNVAKNPAAEMAHYNLGLVLKYQGRFQEAIGHFEQALRLKPDSPDIHNNLGATLWQVGRAQEAMRHYELALRIKPDSAEAHYYLGLALAQEGRIEEVIDHWRQALRSKPDFAEAHYNLGVVLERVGRAQEAIEHYEQALRIKPDYVKAHYNLGVALARLGRMPEAIGHYEKALSIRSDYAEAHNGLGLALMRLGRAPEAMAHWEQALQLKPDFAEAHYNLGVALKEAGRAQEAIGHYEQALRIEPDFAEAQKELARLQAVK